MGYKQRQDYHRAIACIWGFIRTELHDAINFRNMHANHRIYIQATHSPMQSRE